MSHNVLVTGGRGFVGRYLQDALPIYWPDASLLDVRSTERSATVDLLDAGAVDNLIKRGRPQFVVHLAAQSSVGLAGQDAERTWSVNLVGSTNLAVAIARHAPEATVLFASSAEVYGASYLGGRVYEHTPPLPLNHYGKSKLLAERMFTEVLPDSNRLIVARPTNHTGAGQRIDFVIPAFAAQIARAEAGLQEPVISVGNLESRRDFLDVQDVTRAYIALLTKASTLPHRSVVNVSSGTPRLLRDVLNELRRLSRVPVDIVVDPARLRAADIPATSVSAELLCAVTGWAPSVAWADTLSAVLKYERATVAAGR